MKRFDHTLDFYVPEASAVTLGKFDGIHKGHQKLMRKILEKGSDGLKSVVFTFGQMPGTVFFGKGCTILTREERQEHLQRMGIDYMIECPFVPELIRMEPERFIKEILIERLHAKYIAVGPDFRFGYERRGDCTMLQELAPVYGYEVEICEKECCKGQEISSTYIRKLLETGDVETAGKLLGYSYYVSGTVVHGHALGRTIGVPTINLLPDEEKLLPPNGVYFTKTLIGHEKYDGVTNVGVKPTISGAEAKGIETHLFDFRGDLYGKKVVVEFEAFERPEQKFDSMEELQRRLEEDIRQGKRRLSDKMKNTCKKCKISVK